MSEQTPTGAVQRIPLSAVKQTSMTPSTNNLRVDDFRFSFIDAKEAPIINEKVITPLKWTNLKGKRNVRVGRGNVAKLVKGGVSSHKQSRFEPATRSLATFVRSHRSLRSLAPQRSASLRSLRLLAPFTGSLTHFAHSLVGRLKFLNMCSRCDRVSQKQTRFWRSLETRPLFTSQRRFRV